VAQRREILTVITTEIGPYSGPLTLAKLDGRTREAALMRRVRAELTAHCGGNPNAVQRALIERAAILSLRVAQLDAKIVAGEALTLHDSNFALAWNNALRRTLAALGLEPARAEPLDPMAALRAHVAARQGSEAA
jgi:hypothetical protein